MKETQKSYRWKQNNFRHKQRCRKKMGANKKKPQNYRNKSRNDWEENDCIKGRNQLAIN